MNELIQALQAGISRIHELEHEADEKDALIRELMDGRHRDLDKMREMKALIRELVAALEQSQTALANFCVIADAAEDIHITLARGDAALVKADTALAKAKAAGFEP